MHPYSYPYANNVQSNNRQTLPQNQAVNYASPMFYGQPNQQAFFYQQPQHYTGNLNAAQNVAQIPRQAIPAPQTQIPRNPNDPLEKQRRYKLEQQRKFRNFGKSSSKTTMDSMLSNIASSTEKSVSSLQKPKSHDDFGEFLQATPPSTSTQSDQTHEARKALSNGQDIISVKSVPSSSVKESCNYSKHTKPGVDLKSKMMASLDFNQSQNSYLRFQPIISQAPKKPEKKTFQVSNKAANWSSLAVGETEFQVEPTSSTSAVTPPTSTESLSNVWLSDVKRAPMVYQHVYQASVASDGLMDTTRLYPILLQCNLSHELLRKLWSMANQAVPGRLNQQELFILLALIALTQGGNTTATVEQVMRLPAVPVPFLAAYANHNSGSNQSLPSQGVASAANQQPAQAAVAAQNDDFDDFQDFQSTSAIGQSGADSAFHPVSIDVVTPTSHISKPPSHQNFPAQSDSYLNFTDSDMFSTAKTSSALQAPSNDGVSSSNFQISKQTSPPKLQAQPMPDRNVDFDIVDVKSKQKTDSMIHSSLNNAVPSTGSSAAVSHSGISMIGSYVNSDAKSTDLALQGIKSGNFFIPVSETPSPVPSLIPPKPSPPLPNPHQTESPSIFPKSSAQQSEDKYAVFSSLTSPVNGEKDKSISPNLFETTAKDQQSEDKYAVFNTLSAEQEDFQMFQEGNISAATTAESSVSSVPPLQPPTYPSIFSPQDPSPNRVELNEKGKFEPFSGPLAWTNNSTVSPTVTSNDSGVNVSGLTKSNSAKFDLFKSALANSRGKTESPPVHSDTGSVQSLELSLSHTISQQSLGTRDRRSPVNRTPSPKAPKSPRTKPRKYGPSFCDDDYDMNDMVPPLDMPPDTFDEFDDFQEGNSSLVDFDAFSSFEPPPKNQTTRTQSPIVAKKEDESPENLSISSDFSKQYDFNPIDQIQTTVVQPSPTPPPSPVVQKLASTDKIDTRSRHSSIASQPHSERSHQSSFGGETLDITNTDWGVSATTISELDNFIDKWEKCLVACLDVISQTNQILSSVQTPSVCTEVVYSIKGQRFVSDLSEVYGVAKRVRASMKKLKIERDFLQNLHKQIELAWHNLLAFCSNVPVIDHSVMSLETEGICGVCLSSLHGDTISYAGKEYHSTCANFWVNKVDHVLPALEITEQSTSLI